MQNLCDQSGQGQEATQPSDVLVMRGRMDSILSSIAYALIMTAILSAILLCFLTVNEIGYKDGYCTAIGGESLGMSNKLCNVDGRIVEIK